MPEASEIAQLERSFKTVRELLLGRPWQVDPEDFVWTEIELTHFVGGLVRRFSECWSAGHGHADVSGYRPYFLGDVETRSGGAGTRRVADGTNRLVAINLMLIQLHHLQVVYGDVDLVPVREWIEPVRFGIPHAGLDGGEGAEFVHALLEGAHPDGTAADDDPIANIWARYDDLGWLMEGALAPRALPLFAEWLLERVFVLEIGLADREFSAEIARTLREPVGPATDESVNLMAGVRLRASVEGGLQSIESLVAATARQDDAESADDSYDTAQAARDVVSYLVGAAFGQWDVKVPVSDTLLQTKYEDAPPGFLVDDPGHRLDIESRVFTAAKVVLDEDVEDVIGEAVHELGFTTVREYMRGAFFKDHLKRYSRSRRQAPIYWPLSVPSGRWTVWVYAPRLTREMLQEVVSAAEACTMPGPTLVKLTENGVPVPARPNGVRRLGSSRNGTGATIDDSLAEELRDFVAEAQRIFALGWEPNLEDGAVLCAAPLANLCPSWPDLQKYRRELKAGAYPWASVARWAGAL